MANWTYVRNSEPNSKVTAISLRGGALLLRIGTYADLTNEEVNDILDGGSGAVIEEGIIPPATPATGNSSSSAISVGVWKPKTFYLENQLITHEGELLRTLRNFESGETYVF